MRIGFRAVLAAASLASCAQAQPVRGPYLADASSTTALVCWRQTPDSDDSCRSWEGLAPGADFSYSLPGSSRTWAARTLPPRGRPLRFAVFGDCGSGKAPQSGAASLLERLDPDLALLPGDIVYPSGKDRHYDAKYFRPYGRSISRIPFFPALGNHDYGNTWFKGKGERRYRTGYRRVHRREKFYSFDAGDAHFAVLDTNAPFWIAAAARVDKDSEQVRWLDEDLSRSRAPWKFILMHVPLYSSGKHGETPELQASLGPLLEKHKVDIVFQGHDHLYERTKPIRGVVFVTAGMGGMKLTRGRRSNPWSEVVHSAYGLVLAELDGKRLRLRMIESSGKTADDWTLAKP